MAIFVLLLFYLGLFVGAGAVSGHLEIKGRKINQFTFCNLVRIRSDTRVEGGGDMEARIETDNQGRRRAIAACTEPCAVEKGMRVIGGKWTGSILWHLKDGPVRFNDLSRMIGGASKKMIAERLRFLETHGLVRRDVLTTSPVSVQYEVTELGRTALGFLDALRRWSESLPNHAEPARRD